MDGAGKPPPNEKLPDEGAALGVGAPPKEEPVVEEGVEDPPKLKPLETGAAAGVEEGTADPPKLKPVEVPAAGAGVLEPPKVKPDVVAAAAGVVDPPKLKPFEGAVVVGAGDPKLKPEDGAVTLVAGVEEPPNRPVAAGLEPKSPPPEDGVLVKPILGAEDEIAATDVFPVDRFIAGIFALALIFLFLTSI